MPIEPMSTGSIPAVCAQSTIKRRPCARQNAPTCATGWMVPATLDASGQDDGAGAGTDEPVERVQTEDPLPVAGDAVERHTRL